MKKRIPVIMVLCVTMVGIAMAQGDDIALFQDGCARVLWLDAAGCFGLYSGDGTALVRLEMLIAALGGECAAMDG